MRSFKLPNNPYGEKTALYKRDEFTFNPGITVLVGCNGAGKTTLLRVIKEELKKENVPLLSYDNLCDGNDNARQIALNKGKMTLLATLAISSEGEQISINLGTMASKIGRFVKSNAGSHEMWFLFDAIDSGLSVDNIIEVKEFFSMIIDNNPKTDVYIIVSANEYEICNKENCFDVQDGKYVRFDGYDEYRTFILNSRKAKDERYQKEN